MYFSGMASPAAPWHTADAHARAVVRVTEEMYRALNLPRTEPPPAKMWPIPLTLATIETRDSVSRSWAMDRLHASTPREGAHNASSMHFADKVCAAEAHSGIRADLAAIGKKISDFFVL